MSNPYVSRGPVRNPEMFFGREQELLEIAAFLRGNQSISIVGPRKIGKTSLLYHLMREETRTRLGLENVLFAYLDCEVLGDGGHTMIFGQFAGEIAAALDIYGLEPEPTLEAVITNPSRLSFESAIRRLNQRGLRIVLVMDEFERLSTNPELDVNFFNALRSAAGRYELVYMTVSGRPLIELTYTGRSQDILSSPFFNIFAPLFLGLLQHHEAEELIQSPAQQQDINFTAETVGFIYDLVGGHPLALQVACFHAFENPTNTTTIEDRTSQELASHFQYYWHNCTPAEQDVLVQVGRHAVREENDTTLRILLRDLTQRSLLLNDGGVLSYPSRAWAEYVEAQQPHTQHKQANVGSYTGTILGSYEVLDKLGSGGMADVYRGRHTRLEKIVAVKILPSKMAEEEIFRQRFEREAQAVAALRHPNIVQMYDFGDTEGVYYMVMEFIDGLNLSEHMQRHSILPLSFVQQLVNEIASAVDYAHTQGLIHRDIKPSNVMLEQANDGHIRAVLTDFGIAKLVASRTNITKTAMMGTLDYMPPEQIQDSGEVDGRADVYALGVMTYEMLTGQLPFKGENAGAMIFSHLQEAPPDPRQFCQNMPDHVAEALLTTLAKDPMERFASTGAFANAIGRDA